MLVLLYAPIPLRAAAQACDAAMERIERIGSSRARYQPDSLQAVLRLIAFVRACRPDRSADLERRLFYREMEVLDTSERYAEAMDRVDRFFATSFEAPDSCRARLYLWRLHLHAHSGDVVAMAADYAEAQPYLAALDSLSRAHLYLEGARAYSALDAQEFARTLVGRAAAMIRQPKTYEDSVALAHVLYTDAEIRLRMGVGPDAGAGSLRAAAALYGALGDTAGVADVAAMRGEMYAAEGDTSAALAELAAAVQAAEVSGSERSRAVALFHQGRLLRASGDLDGAERSLRAALDASEIVPALRPRILGQQGFLFERRRAFREAMHRYREVLDAVKPGRLIEDRQILRQAHEGLVRMLLIEQGKTRRRLYFALFALLLTVGFGLFVFYRRRLMLGRLREALFVPENLPKGQKLDRLEQRFQHVVHSELLGRRLARLYAVLFDPDLVLAYIEDPVLVRQVERDSIDNNTALFLCGAAVESAVENRAFRNNPANTLAAYLRAEFKKRGWCWPKHPYDWKQYFVDHHVDTLLG